MRLHEWTNWGSFLPGLSPNHPVSRRNCCLEYHVHFPDHFPTKCAFVCLILSTIETSSSRACFSDPPVWLLSSVGCAGLHACLCPCQWPLGLLSGFFSVDKAAVAILTCTTHLWCREWGPLGVHLVRAHLYKMHQLFHGCWAGLHSHPPRPCEFRLAIFDLCPIINSSHAVMPSSWPHCRCPSLWVDVGHFTWPHTRTFSCSQFSTCPMRSASVFDACAQTGSSLQLVSRNRIKEGISVLETHRHLLLCRFESWLRTDSLMCPKV